MPDFTDISYLERGNKRQQMAFALLMHLEISSCRVLAGTIPIEIFGQDVPTRKQRAFLHMLAEHRILQERGEAFRADVIRLKSEGMKTQLAFAHVLDLEGDP